MSILSEWLMDTVAFSGLELQRQQVLAGNRAGAGDSREMTYSVRGNFGEAPSFLRLLRATDLSYRLKLLELHSLQKDAKQPELKLDLNLVYERIPFPQL